MPVCWNCSPTTAPARSSGLADRSSITYERLCDAARVRHLQVLGGFHPDGDPNLPDGTNTLILLGPGEPGFWAHVTATPEFLDNAPDPLDRWSRRTIETWASELDATAMFPFGLPPYRPFIRWAEETGRSHASPVGLLVHDTAGLMVSFRGALAFQERIDLPPNPPSPCLSCKAKPCLSACPVSALGPNGYDFSGCHEFLETDTGTSCMNAGCAVRRACPVSGRYGRMEKQSAYHMSLFHPTR
jgi:hypothetical protein